MKRFILALVFACLIPSFVSAQVVFVERPSAAVKIKHFLKSYWIPITASTVLILAREANAESSIYCQKQLGCIETNSTIGKHPSATATRAYALGSAGILTGANFTWWYLTGKWDDGKNGPDSTKGLRPLMFLWNAPLIIVDGFDTASNVKDAEWLQRQKQARARLR